jgi:hypothetical protein
MKMLACRAVIIMKQFAVVLLFLPTFTAGALEVVHAAEFFCPSGDVTCLIAAITEANQNGQDNIHQPSSRGVYADEHR